jgi:glutamate carboxypeptidase
LKPLASLRRRPTRLWLCIALAFLAGTPVRAQTPRKLTAIEQRILAYVKAHEREQIDLLEKAVNINSGTMNLAGVRAVGRLFEPEFAAIGLEPKWVALPDAVGRSGHLFAERKGRRGKRLLLLGHLDTVFEGEGQRFARLDTLASGAGSSDMKGGDVVILYALKALHSVGALEDTRIIVAFMGDEEDPGTPTDVSRQALVDAARRSDIALGFEEDAGKATVARRGISAWQLVVSAQQAHSSGIFSEGTGYGAIYEAARILNEFRERLSKEQYLTFNPGVILGGANVTYDSANISGTTAGKDNIIAPRVYARGDLRCLTREQELKARDAMRAIVARHLPGTTATINFEDGNPAMPPTPGNYKLLAVLDSVSRDLGRGPIEALDPGRRGAGDISFISTYVDALDGLGVIGMRSHTPDEKVDLRSIGSATERAAILIYRLTRQK